jgi:hypothetical protein
MIDGQLKINNMKEYEDKLAEIAAERKRLVEQLEKIEKLIKRGTRKIVVILICLVVSVVLVIMGFCDHPTLFLAGVGMFLELVLLCLVDDEFNDESYGDEKK